MLKWLSECWSKVTTSFLHLNNIPISSRVLPYQLYVRTNVVYFHISYFSPTILSDDGWTSDAIGVLVWKNLCARAMGVDTRILTVLRVWHQKKSIDVLSRFDQTRWLMNTDAEIAAFQSSSRDSIVFEKLSRSNLKTFNLKNTKHQRK